jgi:hypothetical protein
MNDPAFIEAAESLGVRMLKLGGSADADRIQWAYREVLARPAKPEEVGVIEYLVSQFRKKKDESAAWTAAASLLLNLDETITKE